MTNFNSKLQKADMKDIYEISLKSSSAKNKEVFIFEMWDLSSKIEKKDAEKLRERFLKNKIKVKQITNSSYLPEFSKNDDFVNNVMKFRYVPKSIFHIRNEILIFDDTVAIYNKKELLIINDKSFAESQKQLFQNIWREWKNPEVWFKYIPNHSFYNSIDYHLGDIQIIVWPDVDAKISYKKFSKKQVWDYIKKIISENKEYYKDSSYIITFIWSLDWEKMVDIWKFNNNHVDDRSWPLSECRVYKSWILCDNLWLASGNTLLVLWYEEKLRRQEKNLKKYLLWNPPALPLEMCNKLNFFK